MLGPLSAELLHHPSWYDSHIHIQSVMLLCFFHTQSSRTDTLTRSETDRMYLLSTHFSRCPICPAEPVRPIDPAAWISHTTALTGPYPHYGKDNQPATQSHTVKHWLFTHFNICNFCLWSPTISPHIPEFDDLPLSASKTDMATIVKVMQLPDSGLEIRDRMWLKITIANAVIGENAELRGHTQY